MRRLPTAVRAGVFALASGLILYASLSPSDALPSVNVWDKAQHALTWGGLTLLGLAFWPGRRWAVAVYALALGLVVEVGQATMGLGRMGDLADLVADAVGIGAALGAWALLRRRRGGVGQGT
jgi:VanZ family protein